MRSLQVPRRNVLKIAQHEKHKIDFEVLMELPIEEDEKSRAAIARAMSHSAGFLEKVENEELKRLLRRQDIELGKVVHSLKYKSKLAKGGAGGGGAGSRPSLLQSE